MSKFSFLVAGMILCAIPKFAQSQSFNLDSLGYFKNIGVNVMAFDDIYPEGHQGGIGIIMHGNRVAANGDLRLEATPGQWQPIPLQQERHLDIPSNTITVHLSYPDSSRHLKGFNPMIYPDLELNYQVKVKSVGKSILVSVDLDQPLPQEFIGKVGFNLELFPGALFGKTWIMDDQNGHFPIQPNGPNQIVNPEYHSGSYNPINANNIIAQPYAAGKQLVIQPDDPYNRLTIESKGTNLQLLDGRVNHNNGWFVVRSEIAPNTSKSAIEWIITPNVVKDWVYKPVVQLSQLGYHPAQPKEAVIELDQRDTLWHSAQLFHITSTGKQLIKNIKPKDAGNFLRYRYLKVDFSHVMEEGLYQIKYGKSESAVFRIAEDVYDRGVWQPVLEYFLPVQMCHMRVNEKYRVWHGCCHMDDAQMAPTSHNHFDGYVQGASTLTDFQTGDVVPGLNVGGWHDAGDYDLRVESQSGEVYILTLGHEAFKINYDETTINQETKITEIHQPDGKQDMLQQIEHGVLSLVGAYQSMGRLYRGIICNNLRQYVMLGDAVNMTDNILGNIDDRWVFTEDNAYREMSTAAHMAAASRVLKGYNDTLSQQALEVAMHLYELTKGKDNIQSVQIHAATELFLTTGENHYKEYLLSQTKYIKNHIQETGWFIGRADHVMRNQKFSTELRKGLLQYSDQLDKLGQETPYGIPYHPHIWGAGWGIQALGFQHYFLTKAYPEIFDSDIVFNALNFVLGCHPGKNTKSFASGVGANSATTAYGVNRGDWSFIPGGVISGTALIRPDFPELLDFPFLWQQTEYVMGGGSSHYMFLVLSVQQLLNDDVQ
ncbi:glycoside hydrolase [Labilibacter sediminis]|nr:glycoside hydrolase [Labilibacter sediminis]